MIEKKIGKMSQDRRVYPPFVAGPAAEAEALEFDKIDLDLNLARSCPARGPADLQATASAADPSRAAWGLAG